MSKLADTNKKIEDAVVKGYKGIENAVVGGYKKIEEGVVDGFNKVSDTYNEKGPAQLWIKNAGPFKKRLVFS